MSSKKHRNKAKSISVKGEKSYYSFFVYCCIVLLVGIFLPQSSGIHYLKFSFIYIIVIPACLIAWVYLKYIKNKEKGPLYASIWAVFCVTFSLYTIVNVIYTKSQDDTLFFTSEISNVASRGYRSPASVLFPLEDGVISLIVTNEYPVKEKMKQGQVVKISGQYKKGLFSSIMIVDYTID